MTRLSLFVFISMVLNISIQGGAFARSHHLYAGSGRVYGFRHSACKSASCFRKHPTGTYVHPLTARRHYK